MSDSHEYQVVRSGPPRVLRSAIGGVWYIGYPPYRVCNDGSHLILGRKRELHPDDAADIESAYQCREDWRNGKLVVEP